MPLLPARFAAIILTFAPLFVHRSWRHAQALLLGAILCPGRRTVASVLRITGRARERRFVNAHRVLNRAARSPRAGARILLGHLVDAFAPRGTVVLGLDDTIERRSREAHPGAGYLPRSRALVRRPLRQDERPALAQSDAAGRDPLGRPGLGAAVPDRARLPRRRASRRGERRHAPAPGCGPLRSGPAPAVGTGRRPRKKGARQPSLSQRLTDQNTAWTRVCVPGWYGTGPCTITLASATAVWHRDGLPVVPLRWVLIRDPHDAFAPQALLCTDTDRNPVQIVACLILSLSKDRAALERRGHLPRDAD